MKLRPSRSILAPPLIAIALTTTAFANGCTSSTQTGNADVEEWISLFNGRDLEGWVIKIAGHDLNENFANTFRVNDSLIQVRYDGYDDFNDQFGHLFFDQPFSHYRLVVEYRFVGDQAPGGPDWAQRNSGVMLHSQDPRTMLRDQDFPISVETQFLGGLVEGQSRPTANVCSPGTEIVLDSQVAAAHCNESQSQTFHGDQWVRAEVIVLGDSLITHLVNGDTVLQYGTIRVGGGVVNGYDPAMKIDGTPLASGYIALQSESHAIDFRRVGLLNLVGCMDPAATNFKTYYIRSDSTECNYSRQQ